MRHPRLTLLIAVAALGSAAIGGCGGDKQPAPEQAGAPSGSSSAKADEGSKSAKPRHGSGEATTPKQTQPEPQAQSEAASEADAEAAREPVEDEAEPGDPLSPEDEYARCLESPAAELEGCESVEQRASEDRAVAREQRKQRRIDRCVRKADNSKEEQACLPPEQGGPGGAGEQPLPTSVRRCLDKAETDAQRHRCARG